MANRPMDLFVVPGLGSCTYDMASLGEKDQDFYLWGAMGGAAMIGLGLALAKPSVKVAVITGDGEMLMGMGSLATIGVQRPANLAIVVFDNQHYGETGMQPSHTEFGVSLTGVARSCGLDSVFDIADETSLRELAERLRGFAGTIFARVAVRADEPPRVLPSRDGVFLKNRFRRAAGGQ
jgi:thiamine pyrophosphate-dependent acetolactate synthase large subunit-like protein